MVYSTLPETLAVIRLLGYYDLSSSIGNITKRINSAPKLLNKNFSNLLYDVKFLPPP